MTCGEWRDGADIGTGGHSAGVPVTTTAAAARLWRPVDLATMCRGEARANYCEDRDIAPALTLTAGITKYLPCGSIGGWGGGGSGAGAGRIHDRGGMQQRAEQQGNGANTRE